METIEYLPNYEHALQKIQANVNKSLYVKVNEIRTSRRLTWNELVIGLFEKLVDDVPPREPEPPKKPTMERYFDESLCGFPRAS